NYPCPLCVQPAESYGRDDTDALNIKCPRCGRFNLSLEAEPLPLAEEDKLRLSAVCRRTGTPSSPIIITSDNIDALLNSLPVHTPLEKLDNLLVLLAERTQQLGQGFDFNVAI